jgi:hypothetical protein
MTIIAVVGASDCSPREAELAEAVGRGLAEAGARAAGGLTIGVLPGISADEANPDVDIPIVTGLGEARNVVIVRSAQAVIAVGGEFGTLSEMAFALKLGRPVIGLETWQLAERGQPSQAIVYAATPHEAVRLALDTYAASAGAEAME